MPQWEYTTLNLSEVPRRALDTDLLNGPRTPGLGTGVHTRQRSRLPQAQDRAGATGQAPRYSR
jgi:hypothetical protein